MPDTLSSLSELKIHTSNSLCPKSWQVGQKSGGKEMSDDSTFLRAMIEEATKDRSQAVLGVQEDL